MILTLGGKEEALGGLPKRNDSSEIPEIRLRWSNVVQLILSASGTTTPTV